jgi:basic amino acid/polyamine antiporter, APA family
LAFGFWCALLAVTGTYESLVVFAMFSAWIFYGCTAAAVLVLRRKYPERARPYKMAGYPVTLLLFVAVALGFVVNTCISTPGPAIAGTLLMAAGVPVYFFWRTPAR